MAANTASQLVDLVNGARCGRGVPRGARCIALPAGVALSMAFASPAALALDAGPLRWTVAHSADSAGSAVSATARIALTNVSPRAGATVRAQLASRQAYAAAGLAYPRAAQSLQITQQATGPGQVVVTVGGLSAQGRVDLLLSLSDQVSMSLAAYRIDFNQPPREVTALPPAPGGAAVHAAPATATATAAATTTTSAAAATDADADAVRQAIDAWARAWSRRDIEAYVSAYTPHFSGRDGSGTAQARERWLRERRERLQGRRRIAVTVANLTLQRTGPRIVAQFDQHYRADGAEVVSRKQLEWVNVQGRWLIDAEGNAR